MKHVLKACIGRLADRLADWRGPAWPQLPPSVVLAEELRQTVSKTAMLPEPAPGQQEPQWSRNLRDIRHLIQTSKPDDFLRWKVIRDTMFVNNSLTSLRQWKWLNASPQRARWIGALEEASVGHPIPFLLNRLTSGNQINHAYHLAQFEFATGQTVDNAQLVFEFGGGYGSMCRQVHKLGFHGRYLIFDLAEFSSLQRYFLKSIGLNVLPIDQWVKQESGVALVSDIAELGRILPQVVASISRRMFMATWSLSEVPLELRAQIHPLVKSFDYYLIAYQTAFGSVQNIGYFAQWIEQNSEVRWHNYPVPAIKNSNWYLMGSKNHALKSTIGK